PSSWPSFHPNLIAYLPTPSAESAFTGGLYIGNSPGLSCTGWPGRRPDFVRSSSHRAHGQASRRKGKEYLETCPSFHSISTPSPVFSWTFTDLGSAEAIANSIAEEKEARGA